MHALGRSRFGCKRLYHPNRRDRLVALKLENRMPDKPATGRPTKIVWVSDFQIEWLADIPEELRTLPRRHPATWQMVLLSEFEQHPELEVHIVLLRKQIQRAM